jgi:8-oxo-dGTP pyrophosphatase MutT (NUDIX family)
MAGTSHPLRERPKYSWQLPAKYLQNGDERFIVIAGMPKQPRPSPTRAKFPIREDVRLQPGTEVHVAGVCLRDKIGEWEVLIAQRTANRQIFPGRWECGGGRVKPGEGFDDAIRRKVFEEFGLDIEVSDLLETYKIQVKGKPLIPGLRFLCVAGDGEVTLNRREFSQYRWVGFPVPGDLLYIDDVKKILDILSTDLPAALPKKGPQSVGVISVPQSKIIH